MLDVIHNPEDLRKLDIGVLEELARECRDEIIQTVSRTGGHLATNLGVVELTLALHYVFDTPRDRIIWDVGHQVYTHKILTGRLNAFRTGLRQYGGLSGFPKKAESEYDHYDTGHSGTSISFALGMAEALHARGIQNRVIAVIGDGSMTTGVAFEALNHGGQVNNPNLIVILNDNEMSISPNVGALSEYISRRIASPRSTQIRKTTKAILHAIPKAGDDLIRLVRKLERSVKDLIQPGLLFEEMGFQYLGPFDGHRIDGLVDIFRNIRHIPGPLLIHVLTRKGCGYKPAEIEPERFHGASAFDVSTGRFIQKNESPSYTEIFGKALIDLAHSDDRVVAITAAMTLGTGLDGFVKVFPDRFYDVGIAEQHAVAFAGGLAQEGYRPVVAIYSTFLQRAYDQVFHDVCLQNLPVIFALDRGGLVGADGPTHHGVFDFSYLRHLPNISVIAPRDENELRRALFAAAEHDQPVVIRYPRAAGMGVVVEADPRPLNWGESELLREGSDITVLGAGPMVYEALKAAEILEQSGIDVEVIDARFIKPLDSTLILKSIRKTRRLLTLEENSLAGGFGSAVIETLTGQDISFCHVDCMGIPDQFIPMGSQGELRNDLGLSANELIRRIRLLVPASGSSRHNRDKKMKTTLDGSHPGRRTGNEKKTG
ncbi:1-deoxy-D-xylulose-5-phosphate synthase [bacterium]|nr:1-deoxy-D-xylulose-5-phosphate synthase [candidate division CSSED10-310 bacterium]